MDDRRHSDALQTKIEQIIDTGWASIPWSDLYRWFGKKRLSKEVWREIRDRLEREHHKSHTDPFLKKVYLLDCQAGVLITYADEKEWVEIHDKADAGPKLTN